MITRKGRGPKLVRKGSGEDTGPDPLSAAERCGARRSGDQPVFREFQLVTAGRDPGVDALAIICATLEPLPAKERAALLSYVSSRYGLVVVET